MTRLYDDHPSEQGHAVLDGKDRRRQWNGDHDGRAWVRAVASHRIKLVERTA